MKKLGIGCAGMLVLSIVILIIGGNQVPTSTTRDAASTATLVASQPTSVVPGSQWSYSAQEDPMGGRAFSATVSSTNSLSFDFPYQGEQHGRLQLRTHPRHGRDVIVVIEKGQIQCPSYEGCNVLVRFDDAEAGSFSANPASDNDPTFVFISNYQRFVDRMRRAKRVRISLEVYQEGNPVLDFDVSGFDPAKYKSGG